MGPISPLGSLGSMALLGPMGPYGPLNSKDPFGLGPIDLLVPMAPGIQWVVWVQ